MRLERGGTWRQMCGREMRDVGGSRCYGASNDIVAILVVEVVEMGRWSVR